MKKINLILGLIFLFALFSCTKDSFSTESDILPLDQEISSTSKEYMVFESWGALFSQIQADPTNKTTKWTTLADVIQQEHNSFYKNRAGSRSTTDSHKYITTDKQGIVVDLFPFLSLTPYLSAEGGIRIGDLSIVFTNDQVFSSTDKSVSYVQDKSSSKIEGNQTDKYTDVYVSDIKFPRNSNSEKSSPNYSKLDYVLEGRNYLNLFMNAGLICLNPNTSNDDAVFLVDFYITKSVLSTNPYGAPTPVSDYGSTEISIGFFSIELYGTLLFDAFGNQVWTTEDAYEPIYNRLIYNAYNSSSYDCDDIGEIELQMDEIFYEGEFPDGSTVEGTYDGIGEYYYF